MKSFTDCLNFIDNMIQYNVEKVDSMDGLESLRVFILDDYIKKKRRRAGCSNVYTLSD